MIILDAYLLEKCRNQPRCWWCGQPPARGCRLDPNHIMGKGMGGGSQLDIKENVIPMCRLCHNEFHAGHITRDDCFILLDARYGLPAGTCKRKTMLLRRVRQR